MEYISFLRGNWRWLLAGFLLSFTSSYGQTFFIAIYAGEIREAYGLSHGAWGGIYTLGTTASAVLVIWAGALTDKFRVRALGMVTMVLLALACLAMAAMPGHWTWALVLLIFALRFTGQGMMSHLSIVAMARWFQATRGRAISIASMGFAAGQAILPLVFVGLMLVMDWRLTWVIAAGVVLLTIPICTWLLSQERTPQSLAEETSIAGMAGLHWTRSQTLRHWLFWLMVPAFLGSPAWGTALFFQQVHLTEVKGWALADFVALMPMFTVVVIATTFASGWAIDRFGAGRLVPFAQLPFACGFGILSFAQTIPQAAFGMAAFAVGMGIQQILFGAFWAEYFGTRHLGAIKAAAAAIMVFGSAIGPGITGVLIDWGISFPEQMRGIVVYFLIASGLATAGILRARPALPRFA